jgi:hypothetical protein
LRVSENRALRRIFRPKTKEVAGGWRRLHNKEPHCMYASPNIAKVIISRNMRWADHVECMRDMRNAYNIFVGKLKEKATWRI